MILVGWQHPSKIVSLELFTSISTFLVEVKFGNNGTSAVKLEPGCLIYPLLGFCIKV